MATFNRTQTLQNLTQQGRLGNIIQQARFSAELWALLDPVLPPTLRLNLQEGAWNQKTKTWTLIAANPGIANKTKNLIPDMLAHLLAHGYSLAKIDIHIRKDEDSFSA